ncbi:MAG: hypothetical protein N2260_01560 [Syntrophobacterales bacterium]|nr:hypothetical protein [Syntrophobacterales bacterium]
MIRTNKVMDPLAPHPLKPHSDEEPVDRLSCFGNPGKVAKRNNQGFIEPDTECVNCKSVSLCLREALQKEGILSPPFRERELVKGIMGFIRRWSDKKLNSRS